ncbi:glycoside hydrolase superfamily [Papiliotrema laurentii]|uniref:Glycoside hydrolase superfamily n=1 Tax=Papiliotrema laurentii TaxID=5418 RepID=A0AAD9FS68_PAPLA|nr:glycoside hydrolase superfamily [Papiliotrema laurentii]
MSTQPSFPADFHWGYATASAQVEGALEAGGRGASIWDTFSADPSHTDDGGSTKTATDFYHKYEEDIRMMKEYGVNAHRMSLSWSRIIPTGAKGGAVSQEGVKFYRKVLQLLLDAGITPFVTLFHWDLPQVLQDKYKGFLSREIVADFVNYAQVCFDSFGDLVENWFTINEPNVYSILGHAFGKHAPGRSSDRSRSPEGDSLREPYIVGHNLLLAHASAVQAFRQRFAGKKHQIGLVVNMNWGEPYDQSPENLAATERYFAATIKWFTDPLKFGDYPESLKKLRGEALPVFTEEDSRLVKGSTDFIAVNHYTTMIVKDKPPMKIEPGQEHSWEAFFPDVDLSFTDKEGKEIGPPAGLSWVRPVAWGFGKLLSWLHDTYGWDIYVSENGVVCPDEDKLPREQAVNDDFRCDYLTSYADQIALKIQQGVPVKSYLMWAWTDNFEWQEGYTARFGVVWIDYADGCKRYPKKSVGVMRDYFAKRMSR